MIFKFKNGYTVRITDAEGKSFDELREIAKHCVYEVSKHKVVKDAHRLPLDEDKAYDLYEHAASDADAYTRSISYINRNLARKKAKGVYDPELAVKAYIHGVDAAIETIHKRETYRKQPLTKYTPADKEYAARLLVDEYEEEVNDLAKEIANRMKSKPANAEVHDEKVIGLTGHNVKGRDLEVGQVWETMDGSNGLKILEINDSDCVVLYYVNELNYTQQTMNLTIPDILNILKDKGFDKYNENQVSDNSWQCVRKEPVRDDDYEIIEAEVPDMEVAKNEIIEYMVNQFDADVEKETLVNSKSSELLFKLGKKGFDGIPSSPYYTTLFKKIDDETVKVLLILR